MISKSTAKVREQTSDSDSWRTPPYIRDVVRELWPHGIDLDPASNLGSIIGAPRNYCLERGEDGLALPWNVAGPPTFLWWNGPWSKPGPWFARLDREHRQGTIEALALIHMATGSRWWRDHIWGGASSVCYLFDRVSFLDDAGEPVKGNARDQAIVYYGPEAARFDLVWSRLGHVERLR